MAEGALRLLTYHINSRRASTPRTQGADIRHRAPTELVNATAHRRSLEQIVTIATEIATEL
jgi:hypothetical protein